MGVPVTFKTTAIGNPAPAYQWYCNDTKIDGATSNEYTISSPIKSMGGILIIAKYLMT